MIVLAPVETTSHEKTSAELGSNRIRGHLHLEGADVQRALYEHQLVTAGRYGVAIIIASLLYILFMIVRSGDAGSPFAWLPPLFIFLVIGATFFGVRRAANMVMENKTESERDITYEFDEQGYTITTPSSSVRADWSSVHRTKESTSAFFVYPAENVMVFILKRGFAEGDVPRIAELFRTRVTPRPTKNPAIRILILWIILIIAFLAIWQFMTPAGKVS